MYKYHCENLRRVEFGIQQVQRDLRLHIARQNSTAEVAYTRMLSYLVVCWTEASLIKLLNEPGLFKPKEVEAILKKRTLESRWKSCLETAARKRFRIPKKPIISSLPFTHRAYYKELVRIISEELLPSIEVRNRVAHGQWQYAFTTDLSAFSPDITAIMHKDNILTIQLRVKVLKTMASIIGDYCRSPQVAARDFDKKYHVVEQQIQNMHHRDYSDYKIKMRDKYQRGSVKRDEAAVQRYGEDMQGWDL